MGITSEVGHIVIVVIAVLCGLITIKATKKVFGITLFIGLIAVITKYIGIW